MKHFYKTGILTSLLLGFALTLSAQRVVVVSGWDPALGGVADDFNNVLYDAIVADTSGRKENHH